MIHKFPLLIVVTVGLSIAAGAEEKEPPPVRVRALLHDPVNPSADLFYLDESGDVVGLEFRPQSLTETLLIRPVNGSLLLFDKADFDPEKPAANVAASARLPEDVRQAIVVVVPAPPGRKPAYRMLVIEDSKKAFPPGESKVLPLIGVETAIQAGEHRLKVVPGKITRVPPVTRVDAFNMAQTNFYYNRGDALVPFTERQLQYIEATRRLFIVHATPGAMAPTVTTIVDTAPVGAVE